MITPETIAKAYRLCPRRALNEFELNATHPSIAGCKRGTVFVHNGKDYIFVGLLARNRKYPAIAFCVDTHTMMKLPARVFDKIRAAAL